MKNLKGAQFYQACVEYYTTLQNVNTTELQQYGYELLEKSQNRFKNLAVQLGYVENETVSFKEVSKILKSKNNLYFDSEFEVTQVLICIYPISKLNSNYLNS